MDFVALNGVLIFEQRIGKYVKGSGRGLFYKYSIPPFAWRYLKITMNLSQVIQYLDRNSNLRQAEYGAGVFDVTDRSSQTIKMKIKTLKNSTKAILVTIKYEKGAGITHYNV
jgi:hypothetical protein